MDQKANINQITIPYNHGEKKIISEHTKRFQKLGFSSTTAEDQKEQVALLPAKNRSLRIVCAQTHPDLTAEEG